MLKKSIFREIFQIFTKTQCTHCITHYLQQTYSNRWFGTHSTTP